MDGYSKYIQESQATVDDPNVPNKRTLIVSIIGVVFVAAIAIGAYEWWPQRLPSADASPAVLAKFITTDQFDNLPLDQQERYVEALMKQGFAVIIAAAKEANLTAAERQRGLENAMQAGMEYRWGKHLDIWLKLDDKGKADYVKKVVAAMPPRPAGMDPRGAPGNRRSMSPERQKRFIESMPPDRRAQMAEFMKAVRDAHGDGAVKKLRFELQRGLGILPELRGGQPLFVFPQK